MTLNGLARPYLMKFHRLSLLARRMLATRVLGRKIRLSREVNTETYGMSCALNWRGGYHDHRQHAAP